MADRSPSDRSNFPVPDVSIRFPPLPAWLAKRLLRRGERITWVYGPWRSPSWERYVTHPALFFLALVIGAAWVIAGRLLAETAPEVPIVAGFAAVAVVLGSIFVLGIFSGHFTRLVVTNFRLVILQGYEMCRCWSMDELPHSLIRFTMLGAGARDRAINLDALQVMLGGSSDKVVDSKTILGFGKHLDHIKARENDRP